MAISSGVRPHLAWVTVGGQEFPIEKGWVELTRTHYSTRFAADIAMSWPDALPTFANVTKGDSVSVSVSIGSGDQSLIEGKIEEVDFDMIMRVIAIRGTGNANALHEKKSAEKWVNKTPGGIVEEIAQKVGLTADVDTGKIKAGRKVKDDFAKLTDGISYATVVSRLAQLDKAVWFVSGKTLHFWSKDHPGGTYTLNYKSSPTSVGARVTSDCLRLVIHYNVTAGGGASFSSKSWHPRKKKIVSKSGSVQGTGGGMLKYVYHLPEMEDDQLSIWNENQAVEATRHELMLAATVVGDPSIDVKMDLELTGTIYFDQTYKMDEVRHEIGMGGFTTTIRAKSARHGRMYQEDEGEGNGGDEGPIST